MIKSINIQNYRSIRDLTIETRNLCALIGPNSSGKTNILRAIDLVLGEGWATKIKVAKELFYDINQPLKIRLELTAPITWVYYDTTKSIKTITLEMTFYPLEAKTRLWENYPQDKNGDGYYLNDDFKKACHFIYIPSERNLFKELHVSQWTMLGKMMKLVYENYLSFYNNNEDTLKKDFEGKIKPAKDFLEADFSKGNITFKKFSDTFKKYCEENSSGLAEGFEPVLNIYNLNWFYKTLQIQVKESDPARHFDSEDVGAGMQNLILLSIFQTYSELMGGKVIFGIEEPEIYLYPQAQRSLYKSIIELSKNSQIFYTTHNPNFVDASRPYDLVILRKNMDKGTYALEKDARFKPCLTEKEKYKIYTNFNQERNETFFARKILLVEGASDKILYQTLCEEKSKWNIDIDEKGISIIECGGKTGVLYFIGVCALIGHESCFAVWDKDNKGKTIEDKHEWFSQTLTSSKGVQFDPDLEGYLKIQGDDKVKNAREYALSVDINQMPKEMNAIRAFLDESYRIVVDEIDADLPF